MTPSKPTVPVSGRVPALPEDMDRIAAILYSFAKPLGEWRDTVRGIRSWYEFPYEQLSSTERSPWRERALAVMEAGVPGLVQRLTEAEELLRQTITYVHPHVVPGLHPTTPQKLASERASSLIVDVQAFLSVGEGRSREGAGETDE